MTHTNPNPNQGITFMHNRDPEDGDPYFKYLVCWHWQTDTKGNRYFPSILGPDSSANAIVSLGQDFDGSVVGLIPSGPERGRTVYLYPPQTPNGHPREPTIH